MVGTRTSIGMCRVPVDRLDPRAVSLVSRELMERSKRKKHDVALSSVGLAA